MRNGLGIAALCCGLIGILFGFIPLLFPVAGILAILSIVFGSVGVRRISRGEASNKGVAIAGLIAGVVSLALAIWGLVIMVSSLNQLGHDLDQTFNSAPASHSQAEHTLSHQEARLIRQAAWIGDS